MYLKLVNTSSLYGTIEVIVGPFASEKEGNDFKKAWIKVLGGPGSFTVSLNKLPKNKTSIPVQYAKLSLEFCRTIKEKRKE